MSNLFVRLLLVTLLAGLVRFALTGFLGEQYLTVVRLVASVLILGVGAAAILKQAADVIEETTEVLSTRTQVASGLLQSIGTAFPDMALGIVAAIASLRLRTSDYPAAINYAVIAAATTFGSNIYNIGHAAWCIYRQNLANLWGRQITMFPGISTWGWLKPVATHQTLPKLRELDTALDAINALTLLTGFVATSMVLFGRVNQGSLTTNGDLYQLVRPVGIVLMVLCFGVLFLFRKNQRSVTSTAAIQQEERFYQRKQTWFILFNLALAGVAILLTAESMIRAIEVFSRLTQIPLVIAGVLSGVIGCLGEMIVVHNYSIHPNGRIGDAIMGVAMDNIVTTLGAAIVAVMGGIFLGGNALLIIFVMILTLNEILMWQVAKLKNYLKA